MNNISEEYRQLFRTALAVSKNAYNPYSGFCVGAALLTEDGEVFTGVNVESASFGATICAERSALAAAVTAGKRSFRAMAVGAPGGAAWPCGICRQILFEFDDEPDVIAGADEASLEVKKLRELLPKGFSL